MNLWRPPTEFTARGIKRRHRPHDVSSHGRVFLTARSRLHYLRSLELLSMFYVNPSTSTSRVEELARFAVENS